MTGAAPLSPYLCVKQDTPASSRLAALASVARHHGLPPTLSGLRKLTGVGARATDAILLLFAANKCGFGATPVEGEFDQPPGSNPAIVTFTENRFQEIYEIDETSAVVGDPGSGDVTRPQIDSVRALVLAQQGRAEEATENSRREWDVQRGIAKTMNAGGDEWLDLAGQLFRHVEALVRRGAGKAAGDASREGGELLARLDREFHRWMTMAYQAGTYFYVLARAREPVGGLAGAARGYNEAAGQWGPWLAGTPRVGGRGRRGCRWRCQAVREVAQRANGSLVCV